MRAQVADSWVRSAAAGVEADRVEAPITLREDDLRDHREAHPLAQVFPLLDDVLGRAARECDAIMAVSDASGQLLWVCGSPGVLRRAESIGFVEGSNWDERLAGTNAPGMALALDQSVNIIGAEHFRRSVQRWSCAATPIHDPTTQSLLGVLDITGGDDIVVPQTMAMVRAAARMAEAELARDLLARGSGPPAPATSGLAVTVEALGRADSLVTVGDGRGHRQTLRLSRRHSEILLLLASAPRGLSGDELAVLLYEEDVNGSTMRAEQAAQPARRRPARLPPVPPRRRGQRRLARSGGAAGSRRGGLGAAALPRAAAAGLDRARGRSAAREHRGLAAPGRAALG